MRRRRLLAAVAGSALVAGCSVGSDDTGDADPDGTPDSTATATATGTPSDDGGDPPAGLYGTVPESPVEQAPVRMDCIQGSGEYWFLPSLVWLDPGGELLWSVGDCRQRTVAYHPDVGRERRIPEGADPWESAVIQGTGSFQHTLEVPGVYDAFGLHERFGQVATIVVGRPDLEGQPAMAPPGEGIPDPAREQLELHHRLVEDLY